jgi:hypothetical protein
LLTKYLAQYVRVHMDNDLSSSCKRDSCLVADKFSRILLGLPLLDFERSKVGSFLVGRIPIITPIISNIRHSWKDTTRRRSKSTHKRYIAFGHPCVIAIGQIFLMSSMVFHSLRASSFLSRWPHRLGRAMIIRVLLIAGFKRTRPIRTTWLKEL